jgi:nucleoside-diphosphate-sugar epimerase
MSEQQDKATVIVTGSSGLIGFAVCERLAQGAGSGGGYAVMGFDRPGVPHPPPDADNVPCDLTSDESVAQALDYVRRRHGRRVASVVHLAAYYDFSGEPSPLYDRITVQGTRRLLNALKNGFTVEQFIFSSTMLVHAPCEPGRKINEDWPLEPKWDYPKSKVETERLLRAERGPIPVVLMRIAGVYDDDCQSIPIAHQIQRIHERRLISRVFPGDTSHGQAFVHLDDVVEAVRLAVQRRRQLPPEATLLIGEPETLSYDELQRTLGRLIHGEEWETRQIPKAVAKAGAWVQDVAAELPGIEEPFIKPWMIDLADDHYELDISRARSLLGWEPKRSLRQTLPKMVEALMADPAGFYRRNKLEGAPPLAAAPAAAPRRTPERTPR